MRNKFFGRYAKLSHSLHVSVRPVAGKSWMKILDKAMARCYNTREVRNGELKVFPQVRICELNGNGRQYAFIGRGGAP